MSSFGLQRGQIRGALIAAGMPAEAATQIANILGNSAQALRHAGNVEVDSTPRNLRMVSPDDRKHSLKGLDFRAADPDYRQSRVGASEARTPPRQEPAVTGIVAPQQTDASYRVASGAFTDAAGQGDSVRVDVRVSGAGNAAFVDRTTNSLVAKNLRAECASGDDARVRFFIEQTADEAVWKLQLVDVRKVDVVTGVEYVPGQGLLIKYGTILAWDGASTRDERIGTSINVVTGIGMNGGLVASLASADVLGAVGAGQVVIPTTECETE